MSIAARTLATIALLFFCAEASAQPKQKVGIALEALNQVEGVIGATREIIVSGNDVFHDQLVLTGQTSNARLRFLDETNIQVGELSEVKLDRFVYDPDRKTGALVVDLNRGLLRFSSGVMNSNAYRVNTPIAWIGVRGTEFDTLSRTDRMTALLLSGAIQVGTPDGRIFILDVPNTAITIFADGRVDGPRPWTGPIMDFAALPPPPAPPDGTPPTRQAGGPDGTPPTVVPFHATAVSIAVNTKNTTAVIDNPVRERRLAGPQGAPGDGTNITTTGIPVTSGTNATAEPYNPVRERRLAGPQGAPGNGTNITTTGIPVTSGTNATAEPYNSVRERRLAGPQGAPGNGTNVTTTGQQVTGGSNSAAPGVNVSKPGTSSPALEQGALGNGTNVTTGGQIVRGGTNGTDSGVKAGKPSGPTVVNPVRRVGKSTTQQANQQKDKRVNYGACSNCKSNTGYPGLR